MPSDPPASKKLRTTLQGAGQLVKEAFYSPHSQLLPPGPSPQPTQNHTPESTTQPVDTEIPLQPTQPSTAPHRGVKRAARAVWSGLETALRTLQQSSDMFPPVKPAVDGLLACEASQGEEEYDELASNLAIILSDLAKHLRESRSIQMSNCVSNIIRGIELQVDSINLKKARLGPQRLLEAQRDIDNLIEYYRRIEMLFRQLQNNAVLSVWSITNEHLATTRLESIRPANDAHYDSAVAATVRRRQCTPNTRQAVLEDLRAWKNNPNTAKVYWMNGMAGTGKTTIASTFCAELEATCQLAASFFCCRELPDCREATRIVPTISYQLARFSHPFQSALCETLGNNPDASTRSVNVQFEKLIKEPLLRVKKAIPEGVVVVIDALDECSDNVSAQLFLDTLYRYVEDLPIRFFITCRPDQSLSKKLQSWNQAARIQFHLHDIEQSVVQGDIEVYLSAELEGLSADHIRQLSVRSGTLFIFAATVVRYVKPDDASGIWHDRLETMLRAKWSPRSKAYSSVDTLYSTILSAAVSRDELEFADVETMMRILYTVICAKEPMTLQTLAGVLGVSVDRLVRVVDPLRSVLHVSEDNQLVSTLHASFSDYMLNQERSKEFFCHTSTHHHFLALRCFDVMKQSLRFNICNLESSYVLDADLPDLPTRVDNAVSSHLSYACNYWADHLCEAGAEENLVTSFDGFLSKNVLFWLEVLSLKKRKNVGIVALAKSDKWLQECNAPSAVRRTSQDAYKFAILVGTCHSTPHIYVSILALWSREDPMWICYGTRIQGLMQLGSALHANETSALLAIWKNGAEVLSMAVSLDGSYIISTFEDRFIVWDAYTGNQILSPTAGHASSVTSVVISPDGQAIASGSEDGAIYVWDAETADIITGPLEGHTGSIAFSPNSGRITSGSANHTIRIWDAQTGLMLVSPPVGHTGPVCSVVFSPDGGRVASGSWDCTICIWDARTGHMLMSPFEGHTSGVNSIRFSPDGARIASGSYDRTIRVWDAQNGSMLAGPFHGDSDVSSIGFSLDGTHIISGWSDGNISIWDVHSGSVLAGPFDAHANAVCSVVVSPGDRLISGSQDGTICIWDMNTTNLLANEPDPKLPSILSVAFSLDGSSIASGFDSGNIRTWNTQTRDLLADLLVPATYVYSIAFSPDGAHVTLGLGEGNIEVWDVENGIMLHGPLRGDTWGVNSLTFSPDGKRIVSGSHDHTILLWDAHTGNILSGPFEGPEGTIHSVAFTPDGARIASESDEYTVCIRNALTGDVLLGPLTGHSSIIQSLRFSLDGRYLVSGSQDCTICVWDAQTGNTVAHPFVGHTDYVNSVAFSPDGNYIVSGSEDCTIRIWDARTGETLAGPFQAHTEGVYSVAFSPDGCRVVSGSRDGRILIWELHEHDYDISNVAGSWVIQNDGWIIGRNSAQLLWLPPALRNLPKGPKPILIHNRGPFGIDFDVAAIGTRWATCFSG